ncbi:TPA: hypothetical protein MEI10_004952, partial [Klebsiella quasipneumoniae subsp. similipneumoniae]
IQEQRAFSPLPAPAHQAIMLMTEPPWSYPVTCKPAGINIPQSRQGTLAVHPTVRFSWKLSKSSR